MSQRFGCERISNAQSGRIFGRQWNGYRTSFFTATFRAWEYQSVYVEWFVGRRFNTSRRSKRSSGVEQCLR